MRLKPKNKIPLRVVGLLTVLLLLLWWGEAIPAAALLSTVTWSRPVNLSNTPQSSAHPAIVADGYGYVHVFWSEEVGGEPMGPEDHAGITGNTVFYTRWDGTTWTPPLDVLFAPGEAIAEFPAVDVDVDNSLHLVWTAMSNLYYSHAPSWKADSGHAWIQPLILASDSAASPWGSDIVADASGGLHVVYTVPGDEAGVFYIRSTDSGNTWQSAMRLSEPFDLLEEYFSSVRIVTDDSGYLHTVWQTGQAEGFGQAIYYARSIDEGDTWSAPVQLGYRDPDDFEVSWPYLTPIGTSELHLIYVDGSVIGSRGRFHRISKDGGTTWSAPYHVLTDMMGINGYVQPVVDGAGQMHLIINMRTRVGHIVGIYYARWLGTGWSPVEPVDVSIPSAHYAATTVRLGNELHVVYTQLHGGEIWHVRGTIPPVSQEPAQALPSLEHPAPVSKASETVLQTPTLPPVTVMQPMGEIMPLQSSSVMTYPLVPAVGAALLLVAGVVAWTRLRSG